MAKFAHFEDVPVTSLLDVYIRHAEAARDIHAYAIKEFTGLDDVEVDLVKMGATNPDSKTLDAMSQYDSISVSSGLTSKGFYLIENLTETIQAVQQRFEGGQMPAIIISAGNDGERAVSEHPLRLTDLMRNGLAVGEAHKSDEGLFIEAHSANKPNIAATNPFDTQKFHYINLSPDLHGHEKLIKEHLLKEEPSERVEAQAHYLSSLRGQERVQAINEIYQSLQNDTEAMAAIDQRVNDIVAEPHDFHQKMLSALREHFDFDENGYMSGVDGTSFSGPYQAGHISGAILIEEERADANLPALTTEEIMTIAKLATEQVSYREGTEDNTKTNLQYWQNDTNQGFTSHGGHGVFSPEKFRTLLDEAHSIIETNPDIDRSNIEYNIQAQYSDPQTFSFHIPDGANQKLVFEKMMLTYETPDSYAAKGLTLDRGDAGPKYIKSTGREGFNWLSTDRYFGEKIQESETWQFKAFIRDDEGHVENASLKLFAYSENGLIGQMIIKHGDKPEVQETPALRSDWKDAMLDNSLTSRQQQQIAYNNADPELAAAP